MAPDRPEERNAPPASPRLEADQGVGNLLGRVSGHLPQPLPPRAARAEVAPLPDPPPLRRCCPSSSRRAFCVLRGGLGGLVHDNFQGLIFLPGLVQSLRIGGLSSVPVGLFGLFQFLPGIDELGGQLALLLHQGIESGLIAAELLGYLVCAPAEVVVGAPHGIDAGAVLIPQGDQDTGLAGHSSTSLIPRRGTRAAAAADPPAPGAGMSAPGPSPRRSGRSTGPAAHPPLVGKEPVQDYQLLVPAVI